MDTNYLHDLDTKSNVELGQLINLGIIKNVWGRKSTKYKLFAEIKKRLLNDSRPVGAQVIPPKNYLVKNGAAYLLKQKGWHTDNIAGKEGWIGQFAFEFGKEGEPEHHIALNFNDGTQIGFPPEAIEAV